MSARKILSLGISFLAIALPATAHAASGSSYSIGVEGFRDVYREPDPGIDVRDTTDYGSLTLGYTYTGANKNFIALEGRGSYGTDHYKSPDGVASGSPQFEADLRVLTGKSFAVGEDSAFKPYIGLGVRLFEDEGKGEITSLGFGGYDRRIEQFYLPIGASYQMKLGPVNMTPRAEYDELLYGLVNSREQNLGGDNINNNQHPLKGYGLRGEVMFSPAGAGHGWEAGPFVRYWNIRDSDVDDNMYEPHNTRSQIGGTIRYNF